MAKRIENNTSHTSTLPNGVILIPGVTPLSEQQSKDWDALGAEKRKDLSHYLDNKLLVVTESVDLSESLAALKAVEAIAQVAKVNDKARLKVWRDNETHEPVKREIQKQIDVIDSMAPRKEDK